MSYVVVTPDISFKKPKNSLRHPLCFNREEDEGHRSDSAFFKFRIICSKGMPSARSADLCSRGGMWPGDGSK